MATMAYDAGREAWEGSNQQDSLNQYDEAVEDFLRDLPGAEEDSGNNKANQTLPAKDIDEEIKVGKKRKPIAKLDADRLLSEKGIPELRHRTSKRMKLQGKGYEYADVARLLDMYQLWLDDLYPRAKFRDGLSMVEKVGHSKRLQVMRRAWMNASKTGRRREDEDDLEELRGDETEGQQQAGNTTTHENGPSDQSGNSQEHENQIVDVPPGDEPDEDELDALLAEQSAPSQTAPRTHPGPKLPFEEDDDDQDDADQDELDALLGEVQGEQTRTYQSQAKRQAHQNGSAAVNVDDDNADEEEVLAGMNGMW